MDAFERHTESLDSPAAQGAAVTPDPSADLPAVTRGLWVGQGGTLDVVLARGARIVLEGVPDGTLLPLRVRAVRTAGTTAGGIVALW